MPAETQEQFFSRIKSALAQRGPTMALPESLEAARVMEAGADLADLFAARAQQAGMHPHRIADEARVPAAVLDIAASLDARSVLMPEEEIPARSAIVEALRTKGIALADPNGPDSGFEADLGITGVQCAVAETASMSVLSGGTHRRLASLAVPAHIAILRADQIVADLIDWGARIPADPCANEVLISAMSKTADIEGILVPGVHGPGTVHVIIIG